MAVDEFVEFDKQYRNTYIRVKYEKRPEKEVVFIVACNAEEEGAKLISVKGAKTGNCILNWADSNQTFDYDFPPIGLFNFKDGMGLFFRFPDRQWKRGVSTGNCIVVDPLRDVKMQYPDIRRLISKQLELNFQTLEAAYASVHSSIEEAIIELSTDGKEAVAVSPVFGLSLSPSNKTELLLWKHTNIVGTLPLNSIDIYVKESTFSQEIKDFLSRKGEFFWNLK